MKRLLIAALVIMPAFVLAQQRYLISPQQEVIPLGKEVNTRTIIQKANRNNSGSLSGTADCSNRFMYGFDVTNFPPTVNFTARHKDVIGQWYVAKATGTIDTIFFGTGGEIGAFDSTVNMYVHRSNIGPDYGPGSPATPWFNPPCQNWGYWINTNDYDMGIGAFIEEATGPWVSTIHGTEIPSMPPFDGELWSLSALPIKPYPNSIEAVPVHDIFGPLPVTLGEKFFISMRVASTSIAGGHLHEDYEVPTTFKASEFSVTTSDEFYPSRNWKFYEHDKGAQNCAGLPIDSIKRGWVARGGLTGNALVVMTYNIWYTMTVVENTPPVIERFDQLGITLSTNPRVLTATISDCNLADSNSAGVQSAVIKWFKNGIAQADVPMDYVGGDEFEAEIPAVDRDNSVTYRIVATDHDNASTQSRSITYRVINLYTPSYTIDTSNTGCTIVDISSSGTAIDTSSFFVQPTSYYAPRHLDDGTAGPLDLGGNFVLFGDTFRYAWVGVNGAVSLTYSNSDTQFVGGWTDIWSFPTKIYDGPSLPNMFVAPLWWDLMVGQDSPAAQQFGRILYGNDGNTCQFVLQWDSLASAMGETAERVSFRLVLNRCTGIIEFQYETVDVPGVDLKALVGMEKDSCNYLFVNKLGAPIETEPRNNWCVKLYPAYGFQGADGWNMISLSCIPLNNDYSAATLFPGQTVWGFNGNSFYVVDTLEIGKGYWAKYDGGFHNTYGCQAPILNATLELVDKWNLVGSISTVIDIHANVLFNNAARISNFFTYRNGYMAPTTLEPGCGYWVKVRKTGDPATMTITDAPSSLPKEDSNGQTNLQALNSITITDHTGNSQTLYIAEDKQLKEPLDFYEMPPVMSADAFDVRFGSGRMLEAYSSSGNNKSQQFMIQLQGMRFPASLTWKFPTTATNAFTLSRASGKSQVMNAQGQIRLDETDKEGLSITLGQNMFKPTTFGLGQNYPNPFNPFTVIRYELPVTGYVSLVVYNLLGEEVATLVNERKEPGSYTVQWDAATFPSGIYFYRMRTESFTTARKMLIMK